MSEGEPAPPPPQPPAAPPAVDLTTLKDNELWDLQTQLLEELNKRGLGGRVKIQ